MEMFYTTVMHCKHSFEVTKWSVFLKFKLTNRFGLDDIFFSAHYFLLLVFYPQGQKKLVKSDVAKIHGAFCSMMPSQSYDSLGDCLDCLFLISTLPLMQYWNFDVSIKFFQKVRQFGRVMILMIPLWARAWWDLGTSIL